MIAFGGAAPLHAGRLAQKLGIGRVIIPAGAGVGSAIGFLRAPISFEVVHSDNSPLQQCDLAVVNQRLAVMRTQALDVVGPAARAGRSHSVGQSDRQADRQVVEEPVEELIEQLVEERLVELRYTGQGHELQVALPPGPLDQAALDQLRERFETEYERVYGLRIAGSAVEVVTWLLTLSTAPPAIRPATLAPDAATAMPAGTREVWEPARGSAVPFGVYWRFDLADDARITGPALVAEHETTSVLPAGWSARVNSLGHLVMEADPQ
jgi:N-methylhydantoinase A